jgi:hypothetical protein
MGKILESGLGIISVSTTMHDPPDTWLSDTGDFFTPIPFEDPEKGVLESLTTSTINAAGYYLNLVLLLSKQCGTPQ